MPDSRDAQMKMVTHGNMSKTSIVRKAMPNLLTTSAPLQDPSKVVKVGLICIKIIFRHTVKPIRTLRSLSRRDHWSINAPLCRLADLT